MVEKGNFIGSILGVTFDVSITAGDEYPNTEVVTISGEAGGKPVQISVVIRDDSVTAHGTLLGNPIGITGKQAD